jgi:hypothetical protein
MAIFAEKYRARPSAADVWHKSKRRKREREKRNEKGK